MGTLKSYVENKKRLSEKEGKLSASVFKYDKLDCVCLLFLTSCDSCTVQAFTVHRCQPSHVSQEVPIFVHLNDYSERHIL